MAEGCAEEDASDNRRRLRARRKNPSFAGDEWMTTDDEFKSGGKERAYYLAYNLPDKLKNERYTGHRFVQELSGRVLNKEYFDTHGFVWPILVQTKHNLGLSVPSGRFTVNDVRKCVGSDRTVDVIDVVTQKDVQMTMRDYQRYVESQERNKLYNIISLEVSRTKLDEYVVQPTIVRRIDWVDLYWPKSLKNKQVDATNAMKNMMYPKVQKYCLMSVKGCYTDFHVDLGGTSVWYHVVRGTKVFWLVRPTEENISLYRQWLLSDKTLNGRSSLFLGEWVNGCERVVLKAGQTFFIPSGWIHAVYTPKDAIVFGGNFLHSYSVDMQISVYRLEEVLHVTKQYRYPYFVEMHWFVLCGYVKALSSEDVEYGDDVDYIGGEFVVKNLDEKRRAHVLRNVKFILDYFKCLPDVQRNIPEKLTRPVLLLQHAVALIAGGVAEESDKVSDGVAEESDKVSDEVAEESDKISGGVEEEYVGLIRRVEYGDDLTTSSVRKRKRSLKEVDKVEVLEEDKGIKEDCLKLEDNVEVKRTQSGAGYRRRTRCRSCPACLSSDCGHCCFCKKMVKFGGTGRSKQSCQDRQCVRPRLPSNSICMVCEVNDEDRDNKVEVKEDDTELMECSICYEITHPGCLFRVLEQEDGFEVKLTEYDMQCNINLDLPNSWKCVKCFVNYGDTDDVFNRQRFFKARSKVPQNDCSSTEVSLPSSPSSLT